MNLLWEKIKKHPHETLSILVGLLIIISAFSYPQFWGERAFGVIVGCGAMVLLVFLVAALTDKVIDQEKYLAWTLMIVPTVTALIFRWWSGRGAQFPVQFVKPNVPSPQSVALILLGIGLLILLLMFTAAIRRGEVVSLESHWGGLGGGINGWHLSAPLIYLIGIAFLLAVTSAVAWNAYSPAENNRQSQAPGNPGNSSQPETAVATPLASATPSTATPDSTTASPRP